MVRSNGHAVLRFLGLHQLQRRYPKYRRMREEGLEGQKGLLRQDRARPQSRHPRGGHAVFGFLGLHQLQRRYPKYRSDAGRRTRRTARPPAIRARPRPSPISTPTRRPRGFWVSWTTPTSVLNHQGQVPSTKYRRDAGRRTRRPRPRPRHPLRSSGHAVFGFWQ